MMHTIMPMEIIFPAQEQLISLKEMPFNGVNLLVEQLPDGRKRIERIISSDPQDFLNPLMQPGTMI